MKILRFVITIYFTFTALVLCYNDDKDLQQAFYEEKTNIMNWNNLRGFRGSEDYYEEYICKKLYGDHCYVTEKGSAQVDIPIFKSGIYVHAKICHCEKGRQTSDIAFVSSDTEGWFWLLERVKEPEKKLLTEGDENPPTGAPLGTFKILHQQYVHLPDESDGGFFFDAYGDKI